MTVDRGQPWGDAYEPTRFEPTATTDAEAAELIRASDGQPVRLGGGDLYFSLGGRSSGECHVLPIDLLEVRTDNENHWAVAHIVARGPWWSGRCVVAMNATHMGRRNLGPRAHPNDGLVDITDGRLGVADRMKALRRARSGTHIPHPDLSYRRVEEFSTDFESPRLLMVDGTRVGSTTRIDVIVHADAGRIFL